MVFKGNWNRTLRVCFTCMLYLGKYQLLYSTGLCLLLFTLITVLCVALFFTTKNKT